jgi:hypothetical protein
VVEDQCSTIPITRKTIEITRTYLMEEESGVQTSIAETEIKKYMDKVLNEIENTRDDTCH